MARHRYPAQPVAAPAPITPELERQRCGACGCAGGQHRQVDGKCPPTVSYGYCKPFPAWPKGKDDAANGKKFDAALAKYWAGKTHFKRTFW